jgi:transposase
MHNIAFFKQITNLETENVTIMKVEEVAVLKQKKIILTIRGKYTTSICPHCSGKTSKRKDTQFHSSDYSLKHMPYG